MEELKNLEEERRAAEVFPGQQTGTVSAGARSRQLGVKNAGGREFFAFICYDSQRMDFV